MKLLIPILLAASAMAQQSTTVAKIHDGALSSAERELVSLAEAMPAEKYGFAPKDGAFQGVRTFGEQLKHVAAVNYIVAATALKEKPGVDLGTGESGPASVKSKEQIIQFLKDSYAYAHKAMKALTAENQVEMVKSPFGEGQMARGAAAAIATSHTFDHYGQVVVYARMNGIVPPASR